MIVLDASAAVLALLHAGRSRRLLAAEALVAPHLIDAEVVHALRRQVSAGTVDAGVGGSAIRAWRGLGVERLAIHGLLDRMWDLRQNLTAYDATYVVLAEALGHPLVTADRRLAGAPGIRCAVELVHD